VQKDFIILEPKSVVPNRGSTDPQGFTEGFLGVHGLYMHKMKPKYRNVKLRAVAVQLARGKHESNSRSRIQAIGRHKISPIWTNMFMHFNKGMQVVIKSNSLHILILFFLE